MQYVNLGKTGMKVSRLCLGMMSYGAKSWREWVLNEEDAKPFIRRALDAGVNAAQEVLTQADTLPLIPAECLVQIIDGFRCEDNFSDHGELAKSA